MLRTLRIRNLVIIDDLTVEFGPGLNLLTGETGAGKSIVVDALGLVAGARGDRALVRAGAEGATVEALFEVPDGPALRDWARERGVSDVEEGSIVVRREMPLSGSSRAWLNGSPATVGLLRELGDLLLDFHGQHDQHGLMVADRQLDLLDQFGDHAEDLAAVAGACEGVCSARRAVEDLEVREARRASRTGELERTLADIDGLRPVAGELAELDRLRRVLKNAGQVRELVDQIVSLTLDGEPSAVELGSRAARAVRSLAALDPTVGELARRLESTLVDLQDVGAAFRAYASRGEFDPERLEEIEARRVGIERLCLHYGADEEGLGAIREAAARELAELASLAEERERLRQDLLGSEERYLDAADRLGERRRVAASALADAVQRQLGALAMEKAVFGVELSPARGPLVQGGTRARPLGPRGADRVELVLAANPGEPPRPLGQVASGGERSRLALALHVVVDEAAGGRILVFDEVDSGVSGSVADAVGARLGRLSRSRQILCVTHLPQIAAYADRHYRVHKVVSGGRTRTGVEALSGEERVEELARMLGGRKATETSRRHASELLGAASRAERARPRSQA